MEMYYCKILFQSGCSRLREERAKSEGTALVSSLKIDEMDEYSLHFSEANILNIAKPNNANTASISEFVAALSPTIFSNFQNFVYFFLSIDHKR